MKTPYPTSPTIVFAGANNAIRTKSLKAMNVDALMTSYEYIGKGNYMKVVSPELATWPVRTYLDSGVFTIVRKAGTTRIRIARAGKDPPKTSYAELKEYAERYIEYLKVHAHLWDHIIELDVDEPEWETEDGTSVPGIEVAMDFQKRLHEIVGDRLMPAWHVQRGHEGWTDMIRRFPYVAIGSDTGVAKTVGSTRPPMDPYILRNMVREAHAAGVGVHYLGDTRYKTFMQTELDSADSTTWVSAGRFGQFPGPRGQSIRYTVKGGMPMDADMTEINELITPSGDGLARQRTDWQRTVRPIDMARARQFEDLMAGWGIDPNSILQGKPDERLLSNIKLLLMRQDEIRKGRVKIPDDAGSGAEVPSGSS